MGIYQKDKLITGYFEKEIVLTLGHAYKLDGVAPLIADPPPLKLHQ